MRRKPEPEKMDLPAEVEAYARADFAEVNQLFVERALELAETPERLSILDIGCGPGDIAVRVARARPAWHVTALDASGPMLEVARRAVLEAGLERRIALVLADATATGLPGRAFDLVLSNSLLHHVRQAGQLWIELKRLAAPRAVVLVRDLARPADADTARRIVGQYAAQESELLREEYFRSLLAAYTPEEVREQLDAAGLQAFQVAMVSDRHLDVFGRLP